MPLLPSSSIYKMQSLEMNLKLIDFMGPGASAYGSFSLWRIVNRLTISFPSRGVILIPLFHHRSSFDLCSQSKQKLYTKIPNQTSIIEIASVFKMILTLAAKREVVLQTFRTFIISFRSLISRSLWTQRSSADEEFNYIWWRKWFPCVARARPLMGRQREAITSRVCCRWRFVIRRAALAYIALA